jgi:hypothetical protein
MSSCQRLEASVTISGIPRIFSKLGACTAYLIGTRSVRSSHYSKKSNDPETRLLAGPRAVLQSRYSLGLPASSNKQNKLCRVQRRVYKIAAVSQEDSLLGFVLLFKQRREMGCVMKTTITPYRS